MLAIYFLYNTFYESEHEIGLDDIKVIHCIISKDTPMERFKWDKDHQYAGEFQKMEVEACGLIYTVYPVNSN